MYKLLVFTLAVCAGASSLSGAELKGVVVDPSARPVSGAKVAVTVPSGVVTEQITDDKGAFDIYVSPLYENVQLRVTARGFQTTTVGMGAAHIQLALAPLADSGVRGTSASTITSGDLRSRNEAQAEDLMRETPGVELAQSGPRGGLTDLFVRGGDAKYNLVLLDGIPVNSFYYGGLFDFAHIPSDLIEEVDISRGPQSAIYGSYAIGSVVDLVTRAPSNGAAFDALAEGGTHDENRVALSGSGMILRDWGIAGSVSGFLGNGGVPNADYRNDSAFLSTSYRWRTQNFFAFGDFDSNDVGEPGSGADLVSRSKNNTSAYGVHWQDGITDNLRADVFTGFFLNNGFYGSPEGDSFDKDIRAYGEGRLTWAVNKYWTIAGGYAFDREETRSDFLLRRDDQGIYLDSRITWNKFYINAGLREEIYQTPLIPADAYASPPRPIFPARLTDKLNPRISGAYRLDATTNLHGSFGTGIRPPGGMELAFTNNPDLQPERTESYDVGIERRLLKDRLSLDATWFRNRYKDMIVPLGGALSGLFPYSSGNLGNARAEGVEASARIKPLSWFSATGNYMWLETAALALSGSGGLIQQTYYLGQPLLGRAKQSGSAVVTFHYQRIDANLVGYFRGRSLGSDPNFWNPGYKNIGINVNYRVKGNITVYANLRNALDERYDEVYGYPSPLLNVVAGVKWSLARAR
jgi:outer membrane cobalamin receptor